MKHLIIAAALLVSACYPIRWARFVDESQDRASAWQCVRDDDPTNPLGIACVDIERIQARRSDAGIADVMARELPRDPETVVPLSL